MANLGYIQLTRECNQECIFCSNPPTQYTLKYKDVIKFINSFKKKKYDGVIFTGGEPTLFERLDKVIKYANDIHLNTRIITNGQKIADKNYLKNLIESGLEHIHLSIHSYKPEIQNFLTSTNNSSKNIKKALENCMSNNICIDVNTVINKYNADHLDKNVEWIINNYPQIKHFVWNNLDPYMNRVENNPDVIPKFQDFEISLTKAIDLLKKKDKTFRIERVPLCYMTEAAEFSTETRKIVKGEERTVYFLDEKGESSQTNFFYKKHTVCNKCFLNSICAGVYGGDKYFSYNELYPVFINTEKIIKTICMK